MITINKYVLLSIFGSPYKKGENKKKSKKYIQKKTKNNTSEKRIPKVRVIDDWIKKFRKNKDSVVNGAKI